MEHRGCRVFEIQRCITALLIDQELKVLAGVEDLIRQLGMQGLQRMNQHGESMNDKIEHVQAYLPEMLGNVVVVELRQVLLLPHRVIDNALWDRDASCKVAHGDLLESHVRVVERECLLVPFDVHG